MKKIIPFFILTSLVSSSFLLAQSENRLEATNQVTGCRLEVAGANQTTDCKLQIADKSKTALPSEDLIGQQAETTTNYELPTANCANSAGSLNCHLMMNPAMAEEGLTSIRLLSKLASADEEQGADGAEKLSVQKLLDTSGVDISLPSLRDAVETDEARQTKDFGAELYVSYCSSPNSSPTPHSSSLLQVAVDGDETIRSNTGATTQFAAEVEFGKKSIKRKVECLEGNASIHNPPASATVDSLTESTAIHAPVVQETLFTRTEEGKNTFEVNEKSQTNGEDALYTNRSTTAGTSTENPEAAILVEQLVDSLDDNSIVEVPATGTMASLAPMGKNLGDRILALPDDLINSIVEFLRSPEAKQTTYKEEYQQLLRELQKKYPDLVGNIAAWELAVKEWNECPTSEKDFHYQNVTTLASMMPLKLYRLVALSQAMKIIEDAIAYRKFLSLAFVKYDKNAQTEEEKLAAARAKTYLLTQLDSVNKNIEKLEKAADAVMRLSEQRNRCLVINYRNKINSDIAINSEKAITSYCQFSQKMKEGEPATAFLLRMEGLYLEGEALFREYRRLRPDVSVTFKQSVLCYLQAIQSFGNWNIPKQNEEEDGSSEERDKFFNLVQAASYISSEARTLKRANEAKSGDSIELATVLKQLAHYCFQTAQALVYGDPINAEKFAQAATNTSRATGSLEHAANSRKQGKIEIAKVFEQSSQYSLQAAQASANGDPTNAENFCRIGLSVSNAAFAREKTAQYSLQAAQAIANGDLTNAENFAKASFYTNQTVLAYDNVVQAKNEGKDDIAKVYEASIKYHDKAARSIAKGDSTDAEKFLKITTYIHNALDLLKATFYNQDSNEGYNNNRDSTNAEKNLKIVTCIHNAIDLLNKSGFCTIKEHNAGIYNLQDPETALYYLRHAEIYAQEGIEKGDAFSREIYEKELRIRNGAN